MPLKVLLADDNVTAQNMARQILSDAGYEVIAVSNGSAALKKFNEHRPDLLVLDVYMPGYSGLEVCEKIKMRSPRSRVLLTVGKLEMYQPEEGRRVRADGLIVKPFEASDLLAALGKLAENVPKAAKHSSAILQPAAEPQSDKHQSSGNGTVPSVPKISAPPHPEPAPASAYDDFPVAAPPAIAVAHDNGPAIAVPAASIANATADAVTKTEANSPIALALAPEPPAPEPVVEAVAEVPAESTSHEALVAAFSATPVRYAPESGQTSEAEDGEWAAEAEEAEAEAAEVHIAASVREEKLEEDNEEPESYWIAVRVPLPEEGNGNGLAGAAVQTGAQADAPAAAPAAHDPNAPPARDLASAAVEMSAEIAQPAEKLSGPGAMLMEQWLQGQPESAAPAVAAQPKSAAVAEEAGEAEPADTGTTVAAVSDVRAADVASTSLTLQPAENSASPVSASPFESAATEAISVQTSPAPVLAAEEPSAQGSSAPAPAAFEVTKPEHLDAVAVQAAHEAAHEVAQSAANGQSQADEIAQAVERALARFRDTLIEEIARELEKK